MLIAVYCVFLVYGRLHQSHALLVWQGNNIEIVSLDYLCSTITTATGTWAKLSDCLAVLHHDDETDVQFGKHKSYLSPPNI